MSRALCRALALASLCSACVYQGKARPTDTPLTKAVRFLELDARGRSFDLSGTGVAAGELAEASAPAHRIPDPALVDLDSTIQVRIDRGLLQPVESGVLSEPRSRELLERKKRLMGTLDQIARVLEQRTLATAAFTELLRARRDHRDVDDARRRFRDARRGFASAEAAAIQTLLDLWQGDPQTLARIDRAAQDESYGPLLAVLREEIGRLDAAHRELANAVEAHRFELRVSATLISGDKRSAIHLPGYDELDAGAVVRRDRMGLDLGADEKARLVAQWRSTVELARSAEEVRAGRQKLRAALQAVAAELAPELARALAAAEALEQSVRDLPLRTLIPDTGRDLRLLADKVRAAAAQLGQELAQGAETSLRDLARNLASLDRVQAALAEARDLSRSWRDARPETLPELLVRTQSLGRELPPLLGALQEAFGAQGDAALRQFLGAMEERTFTAVQGLLTEPEALALAQRLGQLQQVWRAGQELRTSLGSLLDGLPGQPQGELDPPQALRVPLEEVRDTALDLTRTPRLEGDTVALRAELFRQGESKPFEQLEASFAPRYLGWNSRLSPAVVLVRPDRVRGQDETFAFAPALSWLHRYTPRPEDTGLLDGVARAFRPGLGIHATFLDFDTQKEVEIGMGATLALWDERLQFGAGVNLMAAGPDQGRFYFFVGSDLISLLNTVGIGK